MKTTGLLIALSLAACTTLSAQQPAQAPTPPPGAARAADMERARAMEMAAADAARGGGNPLERNLFPPEIIMRRQREIGLRPEQRQQITQAIGRLEASLVELQWSMQEQQQALADALEQPQVDGDAALRLLDRVLATEAMVKRIHFQALLQIRAVLTPDQQDRLRAGPREPGREEER